jgi:putative membrane protein
MPDTAQRRFALVSGLVVIVCALTGPLDSLAHRQFAWHMTQHVLLISVAAPLLAAARPDDVVRAALGRPPAPRPAVTTVIAAAVMQVLVLMTWHLPALYEYALENIPLHATEHLTLLASAFVMWSLLLRTRGSGRGAALVVLFVASLPPMAYGVGLVIAPSAWYRSYTLSDQQLAGVVMWAYGGAAAVVGGVLLFVSWLLTAEHSR